MFAFGSMRANYRQLISHKTWLHFACIMPGENALWVVRTKVPAAIGTTLVVLIDFVIHNCIVERVDTTLCALFLGFASSTSVGKVKRLDFFSFHNTMEFRLAKDGEHSKGLIFVLVAFWCNLDCVGSIFLVRGNKPAIFS